MKAPTDKPNDTVQILVTTRCDVLTCSNCTQLLPFRKEPRDMSVDVFRAALRSLDGWPGIRGIFGGNPCAHPRFADLMTVLVEEVPDQKQRGLWTNNLLGHGPIVREVFYPKGRFNLNTHGNAAAADEMREYLPGVPIRDNGIGSWHSPILLDWRDMGIGEPDWVAAREDCDINREWSAAIMQRAGKPYAYFCEVAGAIDGIRGENHGIEAVPGWWRWKMDRFTDQVRQCCDRGCGVPLRRLGHRDHEETYDISPSFVPLTVSRLVDVAVHREMPAGTERATLYARADA